MLSIGFVKGDYHLVKEDVGYNHMDFAVFTVHIRLLLVNLETQWPLCSLVS